MLGDKILVMLIDDSPFEQTYLRDTILASGYEFVTASNGYDALEIIKRIKPDIILLDVVMPGMNGFDVCEKLKTLEGMEDVPIIFLTALGDTEDVVRGFKYGGVDYVIKPFRTEELLQRIKTHLELKAARDELLQKNKELETMMKKLEETAVTDYLTGTFNRRYAFEKLQDEYHRAKRYGGHYSLVMCDIDRFKAVNDLYGHLCGDKVLVALSVCLKEAMRENDIVCRFGGEEFLLILPETRIAGAVDLAERLRCAIMDAVIDYEEYQVKVTMTFGVSEDDGTREVSEVLKEADDALFSGKLKGRNCVVTKFFAE